jgi:hypothetical protein
VKKYAALASLSAELKTKLQEHGLFNSDASPVARVMSLTKRVVEQSVSRLPKGGFKMSGRACWGP